MAAEPLRSTPIASMRALDLRHEDIVLETDRYRIEGKLTLPREGYRSRLSDLLNRDNLDFIALVDAEITSVDGGEPNDSAGDQRHMVRILDQREVVAWRADGERLADAQLIMHAARAAAARRIALDREHIPVSRRLSLDH